MRHIFPSFFLLLTLSQHVTIASTVEAEKLPEGAVLFSAEEQKQKVKKDPTKFRAMNYKELVPVLVQAMQEQPAQIEAMRAEIAALKAK